MKIALAREIKSEEYRVGLTPDSASEYIGHGHQVTVETGAGEGSGFTDAEYRAAGCQIATDKHKLFSASDMIVKVKEPLPEEFNYFTPGQILYTYLHLAANRELSEMLLEKKINAIAYETVMEKDGSLPLLMPMSQIAGRLAIQEGAKYLEKSFGGRGILLGGVPGIRKGKVLIIGGGITGLNAAKMAVGLGADVTIMDISARRLQEIDDIFGSHIKTLFSTRYNILEELTSTDLVIGAVLIPGAATPKLILRQDLKIMKPGAVIVDIAIDQGGCTETSRPTSHKKPTFVVDGIVHYCVANMPGAVSLSSTMALTSVTNKYGLLIADYGLEEALKRSKALVSGLNCYNGKLTNPKVAEALKLEYTPFKEQ